MGNFKITQCCTSRSSYDDLIRTFFDDLPIRKIKTSEYTEYLINTRDIRRSDGNMVFNDFFFHNFYQKFLISPNHEKASKRLFHNGFFKQWINSQREFLIALCCLTTSDDDTIVFDVNLLKLIKFLYKDNSMLDTTVSFQVMYDSILIYGNLVSAFCIDIISDDSESITEFEDYMGKIYNVKSVVELVNEMFNGMKNGDHLLFYKKFLEKNKDSIRSDQRFRKEICNNYNEKQIKEDYRVRERKNKESQEMRITSHDSIKQKK